MSTTQTMLKREIAWSTSRDQLTPPCEVAGDKFNFHEIDFALRVTSFRTCHDALVIGFGEQLGYAEDSLCRRPSLRAFGDEVYRTPEFAGRRYVRSIASIECGSLDTLTVVDTCEYLTELELSCLFAEVNRVLKAQAHFVVSVRVGLGRSGTSHRRIRPQARAGEPVVRDAGKAASRSGASGVKVVDGRMNNPNFRFGSFEKSLAEKFDIEKAKNQPWVLLPRCLNLNRVMVCRQREPE